MPRGNAANLIVNSECTPEERKARASKAGTASAEARRRKKNFRTVFERLLSYKVNEEYSKGLSEFLTESLPGLTADEAIALTMMRRALRGDVPAATFVRDTVGDKPSDKLETDNTLSIKIEVTDGTKP